MSLQSHSAPGSNAGFTFQFERALFYLAKSSSRSLVGIETADDVAVQHADGRQILEQDKHSVQADGAPFGDRSKDLWNTLKIWLEALDDREIDAGKTLFFMVTNKSLPACLATRIGKTEEEGEIDACVDELKKIAAAPPEWIKHLTGRVMRPESLNNLRQVIKRCRLSDASTGSAGNDLRQKTIDHLRLPEWTEAFADSIVDELLGWLNKTVLTKWQAGEPAWIRREHFSNQLHAALDLRKRRLIRERAEHLIHVSADSIGQNRGSIFVKQMHLITDDGSVVDNSIRDFIRCGIEKVRLSIEGNITDDDWIIFEETLLSRWEKISARVKRMMPASAEEDAGYQIFSDASEDHREKLAGCDTEQVYLTSGTYHRMAEKLKVGWHPRFKEILGPSATP